MWSFIFFHTAQYLLKFIDTVFLLFVFIAELALFEYTTICSSVRQLIYIRIVSNFTVMSRVVVYLIKISVIYTCFHFSWVLRNVMTGSYDRYIFMRYCQIVFQSSCALSKSASSKSLPTLGIVSLFNLTDLVGVVIPSNFNLHFYDN